MISGKRNLGMRETPNESVAVTKLQVPPRSSNSLFRTALVERVRSAEARLVLLSAPAGWGKTTLISQLCPLRAEEGLTACVTLDRWDNDASRFWQTFVSALALVDLDGGARVPATPNTSSSGIRAALLPRIINALAVCEQPVTVVLDDYHHITDMEIHEALEYLIYNLPHRHRVMLSTRRDPPLPLARMRAEGDLVEIRAGDLALDTEEVAAVVASVAGVRLADAEVEVLHRRTEGWPAAVHLAALSLRSSDDPAAFITAFRGDQRYVADFLTGEVLAHIPGRLREFLLSCSVLDNLDAELCAAVADTSDAGQYLVAAENLNLFLVPLDDRRTRYRFHRLFADWLRYRLQFDAPERIPEFHRRAMTWFEAHGSPADAIHHAMEGGHLEAARRLILQHEAELVASGRTATLAGWLAELPTEMVSADPVLAIVAASTAATVGKPERAEFFLERAEAALERGVDAGVPVAAEVEIAVIRATNAMVRRDLADAVRLAKRAAALEVDPSRERYGIGHAILAIALFWTARPGEACDVIDDVWQHVPSIYVKLLLGGVLAASCFEADDPDRAESVARFSIGIAAENHVGPTPEMSLSHLALGAALAARGAYAEAETELATGVELAQWWHVPTHEAYGNMILARIRLAQGDKAAAEELRRQAAPVVDNVRTRGLLAQVMRRLQRDLGDRRVAGTQRSDVGQITDREREVLRLLPSELTQREIARELNLSVNTVKTHTQSLYRKLGVSSRSLAVDRGRSLNLI